MGCKRLAHPFTFLPCVLETLVQHLKYTGSVHGACKEGLSSLTPLEYECKNDELIVCGKLWPIY